MQRQIEDMPPTERVAIGLLRKEGFSHIRWRSLIYWFSNYDFTAEKDGVEYLVEVQRFQSPIRKGKLKRLKLLKKPVLFLLVGKEKYIFINLETFEKILGEVDVSFLSVVQIDGRTTLPNAICKEADINGKRAFCQIEMYGKDKMLLTILSRWSPNLRRRGN